MTSSELGIALPVTNYFRVRMVITYCRDNFGNVDTPFPMYRHNSMARGIPSREITKELGPTLKLYRVRIYKPKIDLAIHQNCTLAT